MSNETENYKTMDYITSAVHHKVRAGGVAADSNSFDRILENLQESDRLFIFECDNMSEEDSGLNLIPDWPNIHKITLNEFPYKTFLQMVDCYQIVEPEPTGMKYNLCMLNQRPAAMRVVVMRIAEYWPNFVGTMNSERFVDKDKPDINTVAYKDEVCLINEQEFHHNDDLSYHFNIPSRVLTETSTQRTRDKVGLIENTFEFPPSLIPSDEWFESRCDLFHEGDQEFSEKLAKCFYYKKPFISLGAEQQYEMRRFGFEPYFNCGSVYEKVMPLALDICRNGISHEYHADKMEHNYQLTMDLYWKYGDLTRFINNIELNNKVLEDTGWLMDEYLKLLETIPCANSVS